MSFTSRLAEPSDIQTLADHYALGPVVAQQHTDKVYLLQEERGRFALRLFNPEATRAHVEATQAARQQLAAAGFAVGAPIRTTSGETIVVWQGRLCELQAWVDHTGDGRSWPGVATAAATLARMHDVLATCDAAPAQRNDPWRSPAALAEQLTTGEAMLRERARRDGAGIDQHLAEAAFVLARLRDEGVLDQCPRQLTHGDFQGRNLLFRDDALEGVIDFERLELRPRLYDLAWPFVFWRFFGTDNGSYTDEDWQWARAACDTYATTCSPELGHEMWATLPRLMALIPARGIADAVNEDDPVAEIVAFAKALPFATWLAQHPDEALARLRG